MKLIETNAYPKPITKHSTEPFDMKIYAKSVPNQKLLMQHYNYYRVQQQQQQQQRC